MVGLSIGSGRSKVVAVLWFGVVFLLVRIATLGSFTLHDLEYSYDLDARQLAFVAAAAAGTLLLAWRALRSPGSRVDAWSARWSVVMIVVGGGLSLLGHDSAIAIIVLASAAGLVAVLSQEAK